VPARPRQAETLEVIGAW